MQYPVCFDSHKDFLHWQELARLAGDSVTPCTDCPLDYKTKMLSQRRCHKSQVKTMFAYKPANKKTIFISTEALA